MNADNGRFAAIFIDGVQVANATSHSLTSSREMINTTSKDSGGWTNQKPGLRNWGGSGEFLFEQGAITGYHIMWSKWKNGTEIEVKFSDNTSGNKYYQGFGYISEMPIESPNEDNVTFSITIMGDGELEQKILT